MFVITADQVGSRTGDDLGRALVERLDARFAGALLLPADQTAGDEVQFALADPGAALDAVLELARTGRWSTGLGVGGIRTPLPDATRKATGGAFIAAREAVGEAKRADGRFALRAEPGPASGAAAAEPDADGAAPDTDTGIAAADAEALVRVLLVLRERRTAQGWEVVDLMETGISQKDAAAALGITPSAVSMRLATAAWRTDRAAREALVRILDALDRAAGGASASPGGDPETTTGAKAGATP
ncbi:DNA-binding protein [Agromyces archimandritae]|uniref:DNA-binding protein n=1 Tax=Agromyces archimandritae TaxID=2781962 RepID=A0A975INV3_9MICO|nr:DNA-binding protein [Agromyces archimandritae]QTX04988.1 DNA-binding protein [Agromyces archimandritae]